MPCFFCIAVFAAVAGAVAVSALDALGGQLTGAGAQEVHTVSDTASVRRVECAFPVPAAGGSRGEPVRVPVAITVYKPYGRIRIQVLTHSVSAAEAAAVQDAIAAALGVTVVDRSDQVSQDHVHEAVAGLGTAVPATRPAVADVRPNRQEPR